MSLVKGYIFCNCTRLQMGLAAGALLGAGARQVASVTCSWSCILCLGGRRCR